MSSLAQKLPYTEDSALPFAPPVSYYPAGKTVKAAKAAKAVKAKPRELSQEDSKIIEAMNAVKRDLESLHNRYDNTDDDLLIESLIYEIKAANMKFQYYLELCKDKGIVCGMPLS